MRRRICLALGLVALAVPATGWAQSSSQAQYQGVAPETQIPVSGGGTPGGGGAGATATGAGSTATGGGRPVSGGSRGATSSASSTSATPAGSASGTAQAPAISLPAASTSTNPFGGSDLLLIVLAIMGLTGLGLLLRRTTHRAPAA